MKKFVLKFWPIIFIFAIWFTFASPYFLKGKAPFAVTYQLNNFAPWDAYPKFAGPVKNGAMPDVITQIYPWRHLSIQIWKSGQVPLWNPYSFAGTPLLANYQSAVLSPLNILFFIFPFVDGWSILVLLQPLLAGLFTYAFVRSLKRTEIASLIASVSFMFCGFITVWMGYATLGYAILFLPLSLFSIEKYFLEKKDRFLILLSATIPLSFFSGHFQISIYFLLTTLLYILYKAAATKDLKSCAKTLLFVIFGLLLSMPQLLPSIEFYSQSFRSGSFEKGEIIPFNYLPTFLSPDFFGNPITRNDWFGHYAEWNSYIGVLPFILALYGLTLKKKSLSLFFFVAGILALLLSFDTKLADIVVALKIPVLSTSAMSRIIVVYSFMFSVLSAFGFDKLIGDIKNKKFTKMLILLCLFLAIFIFIWIYLPFRIFTPYDKKFIAENNLKLPTIIFIVSFFVMLLSTLNKKFIYIVGFLLLLIVSFDMLRFATKWQEFSPKSLVFAQTLTGKAFSKISGVSRVMANFGGEAAVYYRLPSLEGYDALYIKRYGEFATSIDTGKLKEAARSVVAFPKDSPNTPQLANLLDMKYVVHKIADDHAGWTFPFWTYPNGQFSQIYKDLAYEFYENNKTFGHAFLVGNYNVSRDPQKILNILTSKDTNLRKEIVLEEDPDIVQSSSDPGSTNIVKYSPNEIDIQTSANYQTLLFMSDNYYPGWTATVDNTRAKIYRADYSFRAVVVPKGKHLVKFVYKPFSFMLGIWLAALGVLGMVFIMFFSRFAVRRASSSS